MSPAAGASRSLILMRGRHGRGCSAIGLVRARWSLARQRRDALLLAVRILVGIGSLFKRGGYRSFPNYMSASAGMDDELSGDEF